MYTTLKKTLLAALPLVGLLAAAPVTFAHDRGEPTASHQELGARQGDFHHRSDSWRARRHFHKGFRGESRDHDWGHRNDGRLYSSGRSSDDAHTSNSSYAWYRDRGRRSYNDRW